MNLLLMFFFNTVSYWLLIFFQLNYLQKRKKFLPLALIGWAVILTILYFANELDNMYLNRLRSSLFLLVSSVFCYKERLLKIVTITLVYDSILTVVNGSVLAAFNTYFILWDWSALPIDRGYLIYACVYTISFLIVLLLKIVHREKNTVNNTGVLLGISGYSILLTLSMGELLYTVFSYDSFIEYILSFSFLLVPIFSYIFILSHFDNVSRRKELELTLAVNKEREQTRDLLFQQYERNMYEKNAIIHDYKNNILHLAGISDNTELVHSYCEELAAGYSKQLEHYNFEVGNEVFNTILGKLKYDCEKYHIDLELQILHGDFAFISPVDASSLFGNIFDNAVEACRVRAENRHIEAVLSSKNGFAYVKVVNTYGNKVVEKQGKLWSTRRKYATRGHGMDIMKTIAVRYQGDMNVSFDEMNFTITVWLKMA
ncbi:MAG: GHKL domain-containing protein [Lachnospiraceae bacterium]|jgi:signal transduction histidine kinase|nr:GHKL domain-containing protein [Lachnospiraceae bacterium]